MTKSGVHSGQGAVIPTETPPDQWAELERIATAALRHNPSGVWERSLPETWIWAKRLDGDQMHIADIRGWGDLTGRGGGLALDEDEAFATQLAWGDHMAAADPATVLKLIAAARATRQRMNNNPAGEGS